jgi:SpoVK/Ycf46/Vps4 family AAA+-type ATPase
MNAVDTWALMAGEDAMLEVDGIQTTVKTERLTYTRNAKIIFTSHRILCKIYSIFGGTKAIVVLHYLDLRSILAGSESDLYSLALADQSQTILFKFAKSHLRGSQVYLQFFWCCVLKYGNNPSKVLEKMRSLRISFRIPGDLFKSDIKYSKEALDFLKEWGVNLPQGDRPYVDSRAPVYSFDERREIHVSADSIDRSAKTNSQTVETNDYDLYRITGVFPKQGAVVQSNQTIFRVMSRGMTERIVFSERRGRIQFKSFNRDAYYRLDELRRLFSIVTDNDEPEINSSLWRHGMSSRDSSVSSKADELLSEFDSLIGLTEVKQKVREIVASVRVNQEKKARNLPPIKVSNHMIFTGNPGTGKTTIARKLGALLKEIGLLSKGHFVEVERSDLVGGFLGQTAIKTSEVIQKALGGILFVDEAYSLTPELSGDQFGKEAVNTLVTAMENHREDLIVIAAGYKEEMSSFINSNPGLKSRFGTEVHFADYTDLELLEIFKGLVSGSRMRLGEGCQPVASEMIELIGKQRSKGFGNAREIRILFEKVLAAQNLRLPLHPDDDQLLTILPEDLQAAISKVFPTLTKPKTNSIEELKRLPGLNSAKQEIEKLVSLCAVNAMRRKQGDSIVPTSLHMVFTGNPGTGKTTVARIVAKSLHEIGCLSKDCLIEVGRADLVAGFVGQTAIKTTNRLESALGGVLFVDEAYSLYDSDDRHNFGKEALETILKFMEDNKDNIAVILAGYPDEMEKLLSSNPGLKSRFNRFVCFDDYNPDELALVFNSIAYSSNLTLSNDFSQRLVELIKKHYSRKTQGFGNGRAMRNLLQKVLEQQAKRVVVTCQADLGELMGCDLLERDMIEVLSC